MATDLVINIASQFLGKKSFADADKATKKLTGSVKSLGRTLGVSLSAAAFVTFGKSAVNSFTGAQKEAAMLANTVKNLGLAFDQQNIDQYINKIGKLYGVTGGQATPALQALLTATGSTAKSIQIFNTALDVAAGTGADVTEVAKDLSLAYLGNTKALKKYNTGLTTAELAAMTFNDLQTKLNNNFAGAATAAAATYTGQLTILSEAANQAKEILGKSLVNAIDSLGGSDGIANVGDDINNAAASLANFIDSVVYLKELIGSIPGAGIVKGAFGLVGNVLGRFSPQRLEELIKEVRGPQPFSQPMSLANQDTGRAALAATKKAELDAIKRAKELAKLAKDQAKSAAATAKAKKEQAALDKAALALGKGQDVFNLDAIQIQAALMAKQQEIDKLGVNATNQQRLQLANDLVRLTIKQDILALEDAIATKDVAAATRLAAKLDKDLQILGTLQNQSYKLTDIKNILDALKPKELIDQNNLNMALLKIEEMLRLLATANAQSKMPVVTSGSLGSGIPVGDYVAPVAKDVAAKASVSAILEYADAATARANAFADLLDQQNAADEAALQLYMAKLGMTRDTSRGPGDFRMADERDRKVTVEVIDRTSGLIEVVQNAVQQNNRFGNNLNYAGAIAV